jgi:hypothetical protein
LLKSKSIANQPGLLVGMLDIVLNKEVMALEPCDSDYEIRHLVLKKCIGLEGRLHV